MKEQPMSNKHSGKHNVTGHPLGIFQQTGTVGTIRTRPIFPFILLCLSLRPIAALI